VQIAINREGKGTAFTVTFQTSDVATHSVATDHRQAVEEAVALAADVIDMAIQRELAIKARAVG